MFVPRSVKGRKLPPTAQNHGTSTLTAPYAPIRAQETGEESGIRGTENSVKQDTAHTQELATLLELALTNYAVWESPELRKLVETSKDGWFTIAALLRHSHVLSGVKCTENELVQALRAHGRGKLEVQMILSTSINAASSYNVRRQDWEAVRNFGLRHLTKEDWDQNTIYVENIPSQYRNNLHSLRNFLENVTSPLPIAVEAISLPPREGAAENDTKCRGFAFIVCQVDGMVAKADETWSWSGIKERAVQAVKEPLADATSPEDVQEAKQLARKCGFRVLTMQRWTELKNEYLERRQRLLQQNNNPMGRPAVNIPPVTPKPTDDEQTAFGSVPAREAQVSLASGAADFPKGCLVFIRNVHPETNRTTLKALLGQAFGDQRSNNEFDYVDYNKGMDSCHVRLSNPLYTRTVVQFFTEKPVVQEGGLDDRGTKLSRHGGASSDREPSRKPIQVEAVDGRKEEIYWEKVPEKVRRAALDRMASRSASVVGDTAGPSDNARSRKRRRKG